MVANAAITWQSFTDAQRQAWNAYATFDNTKNKRSGTNVINGKSAMTKSYFYKLGVGYTFSPTPVFDVPPTVITGVTMANTAGAIAVTFNPNFAPVDCRFYMSMSQPYNNTSQKRPQNLKFIGRDSAAANVTTITNKYTAAWTRVPVTGQYVFAEIVIVFNLFTQTRVVWSGWILVA